MSKGKRVVLGLDVSTKTIGCSIVEDLGDDFNILHYSYISPKLLKKNSTEEERTGSNQHFKKVDMISEALDELLTKYKITDVVIEEPLIGSNNAITVSTLLRFNGMVSYLVRSKVNCYPTYITSHRARKYALPSLVTTRLYNKDGSKRSAIEIKNDESKGNKTLFGSHHPDENKKVILLNEVRSLYLDKLPVDLVINKNGNVAEENYDANDAFIVALGYINSTK